MGKKAVGGAQLSAEELERIRQVCSHFEAAWKEGGRPRIEVYLGTVPGEDQTELLGELIAREVFFRREASEQPTLDDYHSRFPGHRDLIQSVFAAPPPQALVPTMTYTPGPETVTSNDRRLAVTQDRRGRNLQPVADLTLTYMVTDANGEIGPFLDGERSEQLRSSFAPGTLLQGRYRVMHELGRGGMGLVYFGQDERMERPVAIKVMLPEWGVVA